MQSHYSNTVLYLQVQTTQDTRFRHLFNGPLSGTTQKGKTNLDLLEQEIVSGSTTTTTTIFSHTAQQEWFYTVSGKKWDQ